MIRRALSTVIIALWLYLDETHGFMSPSRQRQGRRSLLQDGTRSYPRLDAKTEDSKQEADAITSDLIDKINKKWDNLDTEGRASFMDIEDEDIPDMNDAKNEDDGRTTFVSAAIHHAMKEVDPKGEMRKAKILDPEQMQKDMEEIFAKDTKVLYDEMEQIRKDHMDWANDWAAKKASDAAERTQKQKEESQTKLNYAEKTYGELLNSVSKESLEVQEAMKELEAAKAELNGNLVIKIATAGPLLKASVAGIIVFGVRASVDAALILGSNGGDHVTGAVVQGAIALACLAYFLLS